jgi:hypothetical protein
MAKRSAPSNSGPGYVPRNAGVVYHNASGRGDVDDDEQGFFGKFIQEEVMNPEKFAGNLSIVASVGLFVVGVVFARNWGEILLPP